MEQRSEKLSLFRDIMFSQHVYNFGCYMPITHYLYTSTYFYKKFLKKCVNVERPIKITIIIICLLTRSKLYLYPYACVHVPDLKDDLICILLLFILLATNNIYTQKSDKVT